MRVMAIQLRHPRLVASHTTAASAHGIELIRPCSVELTGPPSTRAPRLRGYKYHALSLREEEVTVRDRLRVTTAVRTTCDLLRTLPPDEGVIAADSVFAKGLASRQEVAVALEGSRSQNRKAALELLPMTVVNSGSPAETMARLHMRRAGLRPALQVEVRTRSGRRRRVDFMFTDVGLVVEVEGYAWHGSRGAHQADTFRFNELEGCPEIRRILRFTRDDVFRRPRYVIRTIESTLAELRADREPIGDPGWP
ncbi:hypothetical protein ACIHFE_16600 [Streptomyces sp. NPDC052396]|uniref:hypothetical protein n=1 Tax=Streptomyces sp. NPDC052396 TaxID=3365689 RepID=UPI0037CE7DB9